MERPDVDLIEGLQPTISIDQRAGSANPRSTVATVTEIYDYLRLLFARLGTAYCYQCGAPIRQQSPEEIKDELMQLPPGTKAMILAPMVRGRKGQHKEVFETIRKAQLQRARVDGEVIDVGGEPPELAPRKNHTIEAVVDRIVIREGIDDRLAESLNLAITHGDGAVLVAYQVRDPDHPDVGQWRDMVFSTLYACPTCKINYEELEPRTFSFNSPYGACPVCEGLGSREEFDPDLVLGDESLSLENGLVLPWKGDSAADEKRHRESLAEFLAAQHLKWNTPYSAWKPTVREEFLRGDGKQQTPSPSGRGPGEGAELYTKDTGTLTPALSQRKRGRRFLGLLTLLEKEFATATKTIDQERLAAFRGQIVCPACHGAHIRPEARNVRIGGKAIHEITALPVHQTREFFSTLSPSPRGEGRGEVEFAADDLAIYQPLATEITSRLAFLDQVGLNYLTLNRPADTLSGGELQRVRLATGIGSGLVGVCYVLDEPSIGLHPRDNQRLIDALAICNRKATRCWWSNTTK